MAFEEKISDDEILTALEECMGEAIIPACEVSKKLNLTPRRTKERLIEMAVEGKIKGKKIGSVWLFRPAEARA
jgi:DNA-binding Lrp family transcriptional regulator